MRRLVALGPCTLTLTAPGGVTTSADEKAEAIEKEFKTLRGTWSFESREVEGVRVAAEGLKGVTVTFEGYRFVVRHGDEVVQAGIQRLDPAKSPKTVDAEVTGGNFRGKVMLGNCEVEGDKLRACFDLSLYEGKRLRDAWRTRPEIEANLEGRTTSREGGAIESHRPPRGR